MYLDNVISSALSSMYTSVHKFRVSKNLLFFSARMQEIDFFLSATKHIYNLAKYFCFK